MKFVIYRTNTQYLDFEDRTKPCENVKVETFEISYTSAKEIEKQFVIEFSNGDELLKFIKKINKKVIIDFDSDYGYPTLEIYDNYRE